MAIQVIEQSNQKHLRLARFGIFLLMPLILLVAACTPHVTTAGRDIAPSSPIENRPTQVLVADFTAMPGIVQLDTSPGARMQRSAAGYSRVNAGAQDIAGVQATLSDTLVKEIQAMGLPAIRVAAGTQAGVDEVLITGQITAIDEGNRARRTVIGFGAGKSFVQGIATLSRGTTAGPEQLQSYNLSANSGRLPGMGVGAAAGGIKSAATIVSGGAHAAGEVKNTPVDNQAARIAEILSDHLRQYFTSQHWIAASAVPSQ
jgi:Domain of unknown function (DUF4410)